MTGGNDKVALVTGAGSGIGAALILAAAKRGMQVVACDYRVETLEPLDCPLVR